MVPFAFRSPLAPAPTAFTAGAAANRRRRRRGPKNCECIRQCKDQPSADPGQEAVACYERKGVPAEEQLSTFPEEGDRSLAYHGSAFEHFWSRGAMQRDAFLKANNPMFKENERPLSECHNNCSFNGYCGENGWCRCFYGFAGQDCREPVRDACINECSGAERPRRTFALCRRLPSAKAARGASPGD